MNARNCFIALLLTIGILLTLQLRDLQKQNNELNVELASVQAKYDRFVDDAAAQQSILVEAQAAVENELSVANEQIRELTEPKEFAYRCAAAPVYENLPLSVDLQQYTYLVCEAYGIADKFDLVLALMWQESDYDPNVVSPTNDYGLMQINIINHEELSNILYIYDFLVPENNIHAGVYMLSGLLEDYNGDEQKALVAYNMGADGAARLWANGIYSTNYSRSILEKRNRLDQYE